MKAIQGPQITIDKQLKHLGKLKDKIIHLSNAKVNSIIDKKKVVSTLDEYSIEYDDAEKLMRNTEWSIIYANKHKKESPKNFDFLVKTIARLHLDMISAISILSPERTQLNLPAIQRIPECTPHSLVQLGRNQFAEILVKQSSRIRASKGKGYVRHIEENYRDFWEMYGESSDKFKSMTLENSNLNNFQERWNFFHVKYSFLTAFPGNTECFPWNC